MGRWPSLEVLELFDWETSLSPFATLGVSGLIIISSRILSKYEKSSGCFASRLQSNAASRKPEDSAEILSSCCSSSETRACNLWNLASFLSLYVLWACLTCLRRSYGPARWWKRQWEAGNGFRLPPTIQLCLRYRFLAVLDFEVDPVILYLQEYLLWLYLL